MQQLLIKYLIVLLLIVCQSASFNASGKNIVDSMLDVYVDKILRQHGIEPNSSTGIEVKSLIRKSARGNDISYNDLKRLVNLQLNEHKQNGKRENSPRGRKSQRVLYAIDKELRLEYPTAKSRRVAIARELKAPVSAKKIRLILSLATESMKAGANISIVPYPYNHSDRGIDQLLASALTWDVYDYFDEIMSSHPSHSLKPYKKYIEQGNWPRQVLQHFHKQNLFMDIKTPVMRQKREVFTVDGTKFCTIDGVIYRNSGIVFACEDGTSWCLSNPHKDPGVCD